MPADDTVLDWQIGIPLLTRSMVGTLASVLLGAAAGGIFLVGLLLAVQGDWNMIPPIALMMGATALGLFLFSLTIMAVMFRGRMQARFVIDADGIELHNIDRIAKAATRAGIALGTATGSAVAAGSGLIAVSQEKHALRWSGSFHAVVDRTRRTIALRNRWRTLLRVYCLPGNFQSAVQLVERNMARFGTAERRSPHPPIGAYLLRSALVLVASVPVLVAGDVYDYGLLPPFLIFCFALATVWFVRPMAWVVLAGIAVVVVLAVADALATRASYFGSASYRRYEVISGDDWALTAAAVAGLVYLGWLAIATVRGRTVPALQADWEDSGES